jgi:hypothetical protein
MDPVFQRDHVPAHGRRRHFHNLANHGPFAEYRVYGGSHNRAVERGNLLSAAHSGINPCFFCGRQSRLVESASNASAR